MKRPSAWVIFFTVFIDFVGFGVVVTMLPLFTLHFGAQGFVNGVIFAAYSAMQFVFSPIWGRYSDRIGRRPVLLMSTAGAFLSYVLFAVASGMANQAALWLIILSRVLAGSCAGNVTVAQAYMADVSPPEKRTKMMGIIGMAIGLGFVFGPGIGSLGLLVAGLPGPGWFAAALSAANFALAYSILGESRKPTSEHVRPRPHLEQWLHTLTQPKVGLLVVVFFLATFAFSCFEMTLAWLVKDNFHLDVIQAGEAAGVLILIVGLIGALVQGGATGHLVKRLGEPRMIMLSLVLTGLALALVPFIKGTPEFAWKTLFHANGWPWIELTLVLTVLAVGSNLARPPIFGMLSNLTPDDEQGATIGVAQGAGSLARILGPIFAAALYSTKTLPHWMTEPDQMLGGAAQQPGVVPYAICAVLAIGTGLLALQRLSKRAPAATGAASPAKAAS